MNLNDSRNNNDARQNLKITFWNTDYQSSPKTYAEATSQNSQQKHMGQTNTHNTNQQSMQQLRAYPQRSGEESNQAITIVPDT